MQELDLLILGAGWTSQWLIPLCKKEKVTFAATTTTGRDGTIKWKFDPSDLSDDYFKILPAARTVLITFPLKGQGQSGLLISSYTSTHQGTRPANFIQLGSTGIWQGVEGQTLWVDRHSKYQTTNERAIAEDELKQFGGCVLNLSGLWGGERDPRNFIVRVIKDKEGVKSKASLHMIHGQDVSRAILAVVHDFDKAKGQRWMLTDGFVYDWWALVAGWGDGTVKEQGDVKEEYVKWVWDLMKENDVKALPRTPEQLGRGYDTREFWMTFGLAPVRARMMNQL